MSNQRLVTDPRPMAMPASIPKSEEGRLEPETVVLLNSFMRSVVEKLNGKLSLGDDTAHSVPGSLDAERIDWTFSSTPDSEEQIRHRLGRRPVGYWVVRKDRAGDVYDANDGGWTETTFWLSCNVASVQATILVF